MVFPKELPAATSAAQKRQWEKRIDEISKKEIILKENMKTLYSISWGQVSDVLWHRNQELENFKTINSEADVLALLTHLEIRLSIFNHRKTRHNQRPYVIFTFLIKTTHGKQNTIFNTVEQMKKGY